MTEPDFEKLRYKRLGRWHRFFITTQMVKDVNRLLPQLSSKAEPINKRWFRRVLKSGTLIFIAMDGRRRIVGTTLLSPMVIFVGQKDWIEDVVVDNGYRGHGIASRLMDMAEAVSQKRDAKSVNLTSNPDRGDARRIYTNRGYALRDTGVFRLERRRS